MVLRCYHIVQGIEDVEIHVVGTTGEQCHGSLGNKLHADVAARPDASVRGYVRKEDGEAQFIVGHAVKFNRRHGADFPRLVREALGTCIVHQRNLVLPLAERSGDLKARKGPRDVSMKRLIIGSVHGDDHPVGCASVVGNEHFKMAWCDVIFKIHVRRFNRNGASRFIRRQDSNRRVVHMTQLDSLSFC